MRISKLSFIVAALLTSALCFAEAPTNDSINDVCFSQGQLSRKEARLCALPPVQKKVKSVKRGKSHERVA